MVGNQTHVTEFILIGFSQSLQIRILLFILFLVFYASAILGNVFLFFIVLVSPRMHTPMYFFLCNLSFIDIGYSSNSLPKMMVDIFSRRRRISVTGCLAQINTGIFLGETECTLLAVMAYDRYIAICFPLYYTTIMNRRVCTKIIVILWVGNFLISTIPMILKPLVFCGENKVDHFVCEIIAILSLACGDISFYETTIFVLGLFTLLLPLVFIVVSYICIIYSVLTIRSVAGRSRAFSTCASHLTVIFMYYGATITVYMAPSDTFSSKHKYIALLYGTATPTLNPLIYSLRNSDIKDAFRKKFYFF
ncbi:olfactory receptor 5V1-like [Dendropsophus ebraccatus]|uniref:olfactory receptor 5V1-like n=1 Tax=Dendropsophus ebraccatus TaxID=150705 RepID=UPI0038315961